MRYLLLIALLALNLAALTASRDEVFLEGGIYFVDADCYSRMTRVERVLDAPFARIAHHDFENFPTGTDPHTTAPFDLLIAALALSLTPFSDQPLDLAGAWVSPLLSLALLTFLWFALRGTPFATATLLIIAVSPMVVQAFALGRPDHQSLTLALLTAGLIAELRLRQTPTRPWVIAWGCLWGFALWITLYEPVIVLTLVLLTRLLPTPQNPKSKIKNQKWLAAGIALGIVLVGIAFDGWRIGPLPPEVGEFFPRWATLLGELRSVPPFSPEWLSWFGYLLPALAPLAIWQRLTRQPDSVAPFPFAHSPFLIVLVVAAYGLTIWQLRWAPYFIVFAALLLPAALAAIPSCLAAWAIFLISLLPVASAWESELFPDTAAQLVIAENRAEKMLLRQAATALISDEFTPVLAPWWLCPAIAYWSGQPCVGGSSHQSLPGIADTARFYLTTNPTPARAILAARQVRYVFGYEPDRLISTSATLLGEPPIAQSLATALFHSEAPLPSLQLVFTNPFFRIFEVSPD